MLTSVYVQDVTPHTWLLPLTIIYQRWSLIPKKKEDTDAEEGQENSGKLYLYCASGG